MNAAVINKFIIQNVLIFTFRFSFSKVKNITKKRLEIPLISNIKKIGYSYCITVCVFFTCEMKIVI
jgi:hypothetical protein